MLRSQRSEFKQKKMQAAWEIEMTLKKTRLKYVLKRQAIQNNSFLVINNTQKFKDEGFLILNSNSQLQSILSAHSTSTVKAVIIRIQLLGPLRQDVWHPIPSASQTWHPIPSFLGIVAMASQLRGLVATPLITKLLPIYPLCTFSKHTFGLNAFSCYHSAITIYCHVLEQTIWLQLSLPFSKKKHIPSPRFEPGTPTMIQNVLSWLFVLSSGYATMQVPRQLFMYYYPVSPPPTIIFQLQKVCCQIGGFEWVYEQLKDLLTTKYII